MTFWTFQCKPAQPLVPEPPAAACTWKLCPAEGAMVVMVQCPAEADTTERMPTAGRHGVTKDVEAEGALELRQECGSVHVQWGDWRRAGEKYAGTCRTGRAKSRRGLLAVRPLLRTMPTLGVLL